MSGQRTCDGCGRKVNRIHRIWRGEKFCATCYKRWFVRRDCPRCGRAAWLPRSEPDAVCFRCERDRPCIRCGKEHYRTRKITPYGPVCGNCYTYFVEPEPCALCGRHTRRLVGVEVEGGKVRVCMKCAYGNNMGNCQACRRHRKLYRAPDGRNLCRKCLDEGEVPCPECGRPLPAGRGSRCEECYWNGLLERRIAFNAAALESEAVRIGLEEFGQWLAARRGYRFAAHRISHYVPFFLEADKTWGGFPGYPALVRRFGAEGLRKIRNVVKWLDESGRIDVDEAARREDSERRRIESILSSFPSGTLARQVLEQYHAHLMERVKEGKTSLRSVRLALRPAADLLNKGKEAGDERLPTQDDVDAYLLERPGQKAALTGFLSFLNVTNGLNLIARLDECAVEARRRTALERRMKALSRVHERDEEWRDEWVIVCLEYFHGFKMSRKRQVAQMVKKDGGILVEINGQKAWIPDG